MIGCLSPNQCQGSVDPLTGQCIVASCGNGLCETQSGENQLICPQDCTGTGTCNGNGICEVGEDQTSCPSDCAGTPVTCNNDSICTPPETTANCPTDCPPAACNNNGVCDTGETTANCPTDCPAACNNNGVCDTGETTANCPTDCPASCNNNGVCDAGETTANCAADCPMAPPCNEDGVCDSDETETGCPSDCPPPSPDCGNGELDGAEECDDGNTDDGDGCSAACRTHPCYVCNNAEPTVCILDCSLGASCCEAVCGNGFIDEGETCDDQNVTDGDGCSSDCAEEMCFSCTGQPSQCQLDCSQDESCCPSDVCIGGAMGAAEVNNEWQSLETAILNYVNEVRSNGYNCTGSSTNYPAQNYGPQSAITPSRQLHDAAVRRSSEAAASGDFNETTSAGQSRLNSAGYPAGTQCSWASLVAASTNPTPEGLVNSLLTSTASPDSCHRLLDTWKGIGVGLSQDPNVNNRAIITIDLGR